MSAGQKTLRIFYWILLVLIIGIVLLTFNFFMNAFLLILVVPPFIAVDAALRNNKNTASLSNVRLKSAVRKLMIALLCLAVLGYTAFSIYFTL